MPFSSYISIRKMPVGRHWFSLKQMRDRAEAEGLTESVAAMDEAIGKARSTQRTERQWARTRNDRSTARGDATLIDNEIDRQIVAIFKSVDADTVGDDNDPTVKAAEEFISEIFHDGVAAITNQVFEVQLGVMDDMMERFESDLSAHIVTLGITRHVERLARLIEEFRTELKEHEVEEVVTYDQVRAARNGLHEATCKVVAAVLTELGVDDEATEKKRRNVMAPLDDQQKRVAEARNRNRVPTDVDPDTGDEVIDETEEPVDVEPEPAPIGM